MEYLYLFAGFILLLYSGHLLVKSSVALAFRFKVSKLVIGMIVVAFGTSVPELVVSLKAAVMGHPDIAMGNIVGSNIANIGLIAALAAILLPMKIQDSSVKIDWPVMMFVSLLLYFFILDSKMTMIEGVIFVTIYVVYIVLSIHFSRKKIKNDITQSFPAIYSFPVATVIFLLSCVGLIMSADWLVNGASTIARNSGVSERVISLSVIAIGTSLPELATSAIAAWKKEADISIGNVLGSNFFNICCVLGITSIAKPIHVTKKIASSDIFWMLGIALLLFIFIFRKQNRRLSRINGIIMLAVYCTYVVFLFL